MLQNKSGIIFGVANKRSVAWAMAAVLMLLGDYYHGMKWYGIVPRVLVWIGAMPLGKKDMGYIVLRCASPFTNVISYFPESRAGRKVSIRDCRLPFRVFGTVRFFGACGRANKYLALAVFLYDLVGYSCLLCKLG
jgi:hypothetical protein